MRVIKYVHKTAQKFSYTFVVFAGHRSSEPSQVFSTKIDIREVYIVNIEVAEFGSRMPDLPTLMRWLMGYVM